MIRTKKSRSFGRAWQEVEIDDEGELILDVQPVHCPRCHHPLDLGGLDELDVHRCGYCQKRTRYLWSDRRGSAVPALRGGMPDWGEDEWDDFWEMFEDGDLQEEAGSNCANGCEDPIDGGPMEPILEHGRWVCPCCGAEDTGARGDDGA